MNSLPFDWQARRFVETHLNFFILEGLQLPDLSADDLVAIAKPASRLSCPDDRFSDFAHELEIEPDVLPQAHAERLKIEIDARAAKAWGLSPEDLQVMFTDFTLDAVPASYRRSLLTRLAEL